MGPRVADFLNDLNEGLGLFNKFLHPHTPKGRRGGGQWAKKPGSGGPGVKQPSQRGGQFGTEYLEGRAHAPKGRKPKFVMGKPTPQMGDYIYGELEGISQKQSLPPTPAAMKEIRARKKLAKKLAKVGDVVELKSMPGVHGRVARVEGRHAHLMMGDYGPGLKKHPLSDLKVTRTNEEMSRPPAHKPKFVMGKPTPQMGSIYGDDAPVKPRNAAGRANPSADPAAGEFFVSSTIHKGHNIRIVHAGKGMSAPYHAYVDGVKVATGSKRAVVVQAKAHVEKLR